MSYKVTFVPHTHECELPDPKEFTTGTQIRCTDYLRDKSYETCDAEWYRAATPFRRKPVWKQVSFAW